MLHLFQLQAPDAFLVDFIDKGNTGKQHVFMVPEEKFHIRPVHHPPERRDAAIAVPVDHIAQDIQAVGIPETG